MNRLHLTFFLFAFLFSEALFSQGTLRGHVYEEATGAAVIYGNVFIEGTTYGTTTDENGFFSISNVDVGSYNAVASFIGFEQVSKPIEIKQDRITYEKFFLAEGGVDLGVINISAAKEQAKTEVQISKLEVTQKQIKALPSTGGEADILQYLQVVPGVITTGDQGGQLFIRGGSPVQNKILLDGMTIYNPFHSIGFFSIFETEIIKKVDVLTGGFNAYHGGRISAVVDIQTRSGNKQRLSGQLSGSPFMVKALLEGPIIKLKEDAGNLSFVLTGKRSIISQTSPQLYPYASQNDSIGLPFGFTDIYGKVSFGTKNGSEFNAFGFNFSDEFNDPSIARIGWDNVGGGINFNILPQSSNLIVNGKAGYSSYKISLDEGDNKPRNSGITEYFLGLDFNFFGNSYEFDYGLEIKSVTTNFEFINPFDVSLSQQQFTTELAGYFLYRKAWEKLVIEPSLRLQYYASLNEPRLEPRLGLKYNATDDLRFKAAGGLYSQNLISTSNERDVVNLFTGFLLGPDATIQAPDGSAVDSRLQFSQHAIVGVEYDLSPSLTLNVEGYIKRFPQIVVVNRNKLTREESDYVTEVGEARGVDVSLKYETPKWYVWTTYSLGKVFRDDGRQVYPTVFDRRHNANVLVSYEIGDQGDFQISGRWNFGSGFPFSLTQGFYHNIEFSDGVDTDILTENNDDINIIFSETRNGGRLPYYHRFDLSATKRFALSKYTNLEVVASVTNVYNRQNIFYFDRVQYDRVDQLPIIPSIGIKFNF